MATRPLFEPLRFHNNEDPLVLQRNIESGRSIQIIKYGEDLNTIRRGQILKAPWGTYLEVYRVITYPDVRTISLPTSLTPDLLNKIVKQFGKLDVLELIPICGLVFFIPTPKCYYPYDDFYSHCGLVLGDIIYESFSLNNTTKTSLTEREAELIQKKAIFVHCPIELKTLTREMVDGSPPIEFVARCIGASQRKFTDTGQDTGDRLFTSFTQLYEFIKNRIRSTI